MGTHALLQSLCPKSRSIPFAGLLRRCSGFFCIEKVHFALFSALRPACAAYCRFFLWAAHTPTASAHEKGKERRDVFCLRNRKGPFRRGTGRSGNFGIPAGRGKGPFCISVRPFYAGKTVRPSGGVREAWKEAEKRRGGSFGAEKARAGKADRSVSVGRGRPVQVSGHAGAAEEAFCRRFMKGSGGRCMTEKAGFSETGLPVKNKEMDPWGGSPTSPPLHEPWRAFPTTSYPSFSDDAHAAVPCR